MLNDEDDEDTAGTDGYELGEFAWNIRTEVFEATAISEDQNGEWGLSHPCDENEILTVKIVGDEMFVGAEGEVGSNCDETDDDGALITFNRVTSETNALVGSWLIEIEEDDSFAMLTFIDDNNYMMVQTSTADDAGEPGMERGTYTYDAETKAVVFTVITDTNGQWGLSHPCAVLVDDSSELNCGPEGRDIIQTLEVDGDTLTLVSEADTINNQGTEEPVVFTRAQWSN